MLTCGLEGTGFYLPVVHSIAVGDKGPYYKSKLELKSNSSEILPVNYTFI